jgi:hypothetical protein
MTMTLDELVKETLVEKHIRLQQEKCQHKEVHVSTYSGPDVTVISRVCLDCWKHWNWNSRDDGIEP